MGKIVKIVAVIAIAAAVAYFAPYLAPEFLTAAIGTTAAVAATAAALSIAANLALSFAMQAISPKPHSSNTPQVFRQAITNSFLLYGKRRAGGLMIFFHPAGKDYRYFVIAVAGHRCKGVVRWFLGDEAVSVNAAGMVTSGDYANNAWLWFYRGTDDQVAHPTFVAECGGKWTPAHRARRTALIYAKFKMSKDVVAAGMPTITAEIEGKDDILDPRTSTQAYSRNGALVFYDFMALPREEGGFGSYDDEIDWDWVSAQANVSDEDVPLADGGSEKRYELDAYIVTGAAPSEVRDTLVLCCAGTFTYSGGRMLMRPGYYVPPSLTLHERDLAGPISVPALRSGDEIATEVSASFVDPASLYQSADIVPRSVVADEVRQVSIDLPHVTSSTRAQRIAEIALRKSLAERQVTWPMNIAGIAVSPLDTVQLATARYGLSNYSFQVTDWKLASDFSVSIKMEEHGPEIFEWDTSMELTAGESPTLAKADPIEDVPSQADSATTAGTASQASQLGTTGNPDGVYGPSDIKAIKARLDTAGI